MIRGRLFALLYTSGVKNGDLRRLRVFIFFFFLKKILLMVVWNRASDLLRVGMGRLVSSN